MKKVSSSSMVAVAVMVWCLSFGAIVGNGAVYKTPRDLFDKYSESFSAYAQADKELQFSQFMHPEALKMFKEGMTVEIDGQRQLSPVIAMGMTYDNSKVDEKSIIKQDEDKFYDSISGLMRGPEKDLYKHFKINYLGEVAQGESVRHIVYSTAVNYDKYQFSKVSIITVKKYKDGWLMMLPPETEERMFMMKLLHDAAATTGE
ncbi:MAG: hypothetical protein A2293_00370 [Elusimicrobia bacterium RIFOXYB2_FULL_49_7]|nr:MAG: hypothetical protein A2293_00370 [Elusimicrobia bacterium RIFOXYB2_FULL_49_7]